MQVTHEDGRVELLQFSSMEDMRAYVRDHVAKGLLHHKISGVKLFDGERRIGELQAPDFAREPRQVPTRADRPPGARGTARERVTTFSKNPLAAGKKSRR